jgi:hypothetical protein
MSRHARPLFSTAILTLACLGADAVQAQDDAAPEQSARPAQAQVDLESLLPGQALGYRVMQTTPQSADLVVLVPDAATYLDALSHWSPTVRFPILIETEVSRADCARFIRAYEPKRVVRYSGDADEDKTSAPLRERIERALFAAWDTEDEDTLRAAWRERKHLPLGLVVTSASDPTWPAALALAAGRGQLLAWSDTPRRSVNAPLSAEHLAQLRSDIETALRDSDYAWEELGDDLDALTVCRHISARFVASEEQGALALTDIIGRGEDGRRYAYAGWIFAGDEATAAYRAMCSLFLHVDEAFFFDGYSGSGGWGKYAVDAPATALAELGVETRLVGAPGGDFSAWQGRARGGLSADFIHVNTMGNQADFQLARGSGGWARDIPILNQPACVHFIHSWSATSPGDSNALAGRWLEHGCYAYVGAVHEPYLAAFLTPTDLVNRLLGGLPLGAAIRVDNAPPWKVQMIGDPLWLMRRQGERLKGDDVEIAGQSLDDSLRAHLRAGELVGTVTDLVLLGRDAEAAKIVAAALGEEKHRDVLPDLVWAGLGALHRAGDRKDFAAAFEVLGVPNGEAEREPRWRRARDLLWSKLGTPIDAAGQAELGLLALHLRWKRPDIDAIRLAEAFTKHGEGERARGLLQDVVASTDHPQALRRLQKAMERLGR